MKKAKEARVLVMVVAILCLLLGEHREPSRREEREEEGLAVDSTTFCHAMGTSTQTGTMVSVTIIVYEYSPPEDQKVLLDAFEQGGDEGLTNALSKMSSKGRIAITGTLGYDLNYIRQFPLKDSAGNVTGRKIRFVTDRPITFGEAWSQSRSMDYSLSGGEIDLSTDKKKNAGTLLPACKFKIGKDKDLEIEALRNPYRLVNIYED
jgi:hypothetical protein